MATVAKERVMVDTNSAAAMLGVSKSTLVRLRTHKRKAGPPFRKVGNQVRYSTAALKAWAATASGGELLDKEPPPCPRNGS